MAALHLKNKYTNSVFYIHKDHLGSIVAISSDDVDKNNGVVLEFNYDAWGHRTNTNGSLSFSSGEISRGYTGHEHIPEYALINMNGRVYDPLLARFLSPDNYVQMPDNSQNFNRFGYCLNNPLIYTDPSGDVVVLTAILVGAAIGIGVDYGVQVASNYFNHDNWRDALFNNVDFFDVAVSGAIGGLTAGYGSALSNGAKLGKFGMAIVNNSALIRLAEVGLTSAIDITGNGWQDISFKDFGTRAIVAGITFGISSAVMPKAKPQLDKPRSKNIEVLALSASDDVAGGSNAVYKGLDASGKVRYVGITSRNPVLRFGEHLTSIGTGKELLNYRVIKGANNLTRRQARVWEQVLINKYGLGKNGGELLNKINSIAPQNWWKYGVK